MSLSRELAGPMAHWGACLPNQSSMLSPISRGQQEVSWQSSSRVLCGRIISGNAYAIILFHGMERVWLSKPEDLVPETQKLTMLHPSMWQRCQPAPGKKSDISAERLRKQGPLHGRSLHFPVEGRVRTFCSSICVMWAKSHDLHCTTTKSSRLKERLGNWEPPNLCTWHDQEEVQNIHWRYQLCDDLNTLQLEPSFWVLVADKMMLSTTKHY